MSEAYSQIHQKACKRSLAGFAWKVTTNPSPTLNNTSNL